VVGAEPSVVGMAAFLGFAKSDHGSLLSLREGAVDRANLITVNQFSIAGFAPSNRDAERRSPKKLTLEILHRTKHLIHQTQHSNEISFQRFCVANKTNIRCPTTRPINGPSVSGGRQAETTIRPISSERSRMIQLADL
jgi:hypothetical protein